MIRKIISLMLLFICAITIFTFAQNNTLVFSKWNENGELFCQLNLSSLRQIADIRLNDFYNPSLYSIIIQSSAYLQAFIRFTITITECADAKLQNRQVFFETKDFQITPQKTNYTFFPSQITNTNVDDDFKDAIISNGGLLLAGKYCFQFQVFDSQTGQLSGVSNVECLEVVSPEPPELIYPENNAIIQNSQINFQWLSVGGRAGMKIRYRLTIAEKGADESVQQAIFKLPFFLSDDSKPIEIISTGNREIINLNYPFDLKVAAPFARGKTYVWQIQAFDELGRPVGNNQGKSQIFEFTVFSQTKDKNRVEIILEFKHKNR